MIESDSNNIINENEPLLIINWTKATGGKIRRGSSSTNYQGLTTEEEKAKNDFVDLLVSDFENNCEVFFDKKFCYHSDSSVWDQVVIKLRTMDETEEEYWGVISYPESIGSSSVKELWNRIHQPTKWGSVNALKKAIGSCSRGMVWKVVIVQEIERMAQELHGFSFFLFLIFFIFMFFLFFF